LTVFGENGPRGSPRAHPLSAPTLRIMIRMTAVPYERCLTVLLTLAEDQIAQCRIDVPAVSGWAVRLEVDGRTVAVIHCADWHHVERRCSTLARLWRDTHTELAASR
jgi:hypothetical protein